MVDISCSCFGELRLTQPGAGFPSSYLPVQEMRYGLIPRGRCDSVTCGVWQCWLQLVTPYSGGGAVSDTATTSRVQAPRPHTDLDLCHSPVRWWSESSDYMTAATWQIFEEDSVRRVNLVPVSYNLRQIISSNYDFIGSKTHCFSISGVKIQPDYIYCLPSVDINCRKWSEIILNAQLEWRFFSEPFWSLQCTLLFYVISDEIFLFFVVISVCTWGYQEKRASCSGWRGLCVCYSTLSQAREAVMLVVFSRHKVRLRAVLSVTV